MAITISVSAQAIHKLDVSAAQTKIEQILGEGKAPHLEQELRFEIDYPREPEDPRELSEIPEVRLWFIRLDALYPWLPIVLDWRGGELARYTAMLVPHEFHRTEGIQYNPQALEIFLMHKIFSIAIWLQHRGISGQSKLMGLAQMLGYELDESFFDAIALRP
ncbi:CRR6 family NdhI maturation factor [Oxynema sp. CENA135]|uniref:CRR6 family NdhI maturation factor n=1 Tax=Oxynema sp. CENA135 TaxID=984206 RepID=UPI00190DE5FB|nr:CRR6 family NdhI maturation factor [Oxynema sp. CENA135]MBK4731920.1 CRR6 family NdhI maturation factor [Oxynema sp. CENA135]